jgi:hypothetical protein
MDGNELWDALLGREHERGVEMVKIDLPAQPLRHPVNEPCMELDVKRVGRQESRPPDWDATNPFIASLSLPAPGDHLHLVTGLEKILGEIPNVETYSFSWR